MHINFKHIFIGVVIYALTLNFINAQVLSNISIKQRGNSVELTWTFNSGEQCQGTWVEHGTDSAKLDTIYHVPGICGSSDNEVTYQYVHKNPVPNVMNYYRLILGTRGETKVLGIYMDAVDEGFTIQGQPLTDRVNLLLSDEAREAKIDVYEISGNLKFSTIARNKTIELRREQFRSGMHVVVLRLKDGRVFRSKLIVI